MSGRAALLLVLAGAALLALWMWQGAATDTAVAGTSAPIAARGYSATNAVLVQTDDQGNLQYRVTATRIDRANPTADVILTLPTFNYSATGAGLWKMTAKRGIIPAGTRQIDLSGNVVGHGHPEGQPGEINMATEQLHVDMEQEIATSQTDVDMNWRGSRLRGHGMHADLKGEKLVLETAVKGTYAH